MIYKKTTEKLNTFLIFVFFLSIIYAIMSPGYLDKGALGIAEYIFFCSYPLLLMVGRSFSQKYYAQNKFKKAFWYSFASAAPALLFLLLWALIVLLILFHYLLVLAFWIVK